MSEGVLLVVAGVVVILAWCCVSVCCYRGEGWGREGV